jgi:acetylornithine deacetylase/succinyl-diaminopimelate desuccinylase-like protein
MMTMNSTTSRLIEYGDGSDSLDAVVPERLTAIINIRVSVSEKARLEAEAAAHNMRLAHYARLRLTHAIDDADDIRKQLVENRHQLGLLFDLVQQIVADGIANRQERTS